MSLETVFANPPPLVGADNNETGKDKERNAECEGVSVDAEHRQQYDRSSSWTMEQSDDKADLEDGELEDGEIEDGETDMPPAGKLSTAASESGHYNAGSPRNDDEDEHDMDDKSRKRRKKKKKDKKKDEKKKKRRKYVDHDAGSNDAASYHYPSAMMAESSTGWSSSYEPGRSPPGPYDTPPKGAGRSPPTQYGDLTEAGYLSRNVSYRSSYKSPPGPYDSPSDDDEYTPPPKLQRFDSMDSTGSSRQPSLFRMVADETFIDPNVAATEQEDLFQRNQKASAANKKKKIDRSKHYKEMHRPPRDMHQKPPKKRSLLETPMNERPHCRFYMEGKCQKGADCPFNHDFRPPKRFEVCKYYLNSFCTKGNDCIYMHGDYPCKFFHLEGHCPHGEQCRFSHASLTNELFAMFEKQMMHKEKQMESYAEKNEAYGSGNKNYDNSGGDNYKGTKDFYGVGRSNEDYGSGKESPRQNASSGQSSSQQSSQSTKKIPSIFDIKVYPPGKGPRPQGSGGPMNMQGPPGIQSPQRPPRGPFQDMSGPQGGPRPRGPPMNQQGLLGPPPPMRFRGMRPPGGPMGPVPMGGPMGPGGPIGPRPMGPGGVSLMGPGPMGPGGRPVRPQGAGNSDGSDFYNGSQYFGGPSQEEGQFDAKQQNENFVNSRGDTDMRQASGSGDGSASGDNLNVSSGLDQNDPDIPSHLPPKQRELFLRIKQHQRENSVQEGNIKDDLEQAIKNENWYSSDEDESAPNKGEKGNAIANLWNSLTKSNVLPGQGSSTNNGKQQGQIPQFDINQMLTAIQNMTGVSVSSTGSSSSQVNVARDPRQSTKADPRLARISSDPRRTLQGASPTLVQPSPPQSQVTEDVVEIDCSIATQTKTGRRVLYILHTCEVKSVTNTIPPHVDVNSDQYRDDPRILKALNKLIPKKSKPISGKVLLSPLSASGQSPTHTRPEISKLSTLVSSESSTAADTKIQRPSSSVPSITSLAPPIMPEALKERPVIARRLSGENTITSPTGDQSPRAKDSSKSSTLAYRNDPRFRKKKTLSGDSRSKESGANVSDSGSGSPTSDGGKESAKDADTKTLSASVRHGMDYASPLGNTSMDKSDFTGFGFYNRPPNDNYQQFQEQKHNHRNITDTKSDHSLATSSATSISTSSSMMPLLRDSTVPLTSSGLTTDLSMQDQGSENAEEPSLRDVFKTLDPTASPFC